MGLDRQKHKDKIVNAQIQFGQDFKSIRCERHTRGGYYSESRENKCCIKNMMRAHHTGAGIGTKMYTKEESSSQKPEGTKERQKRRWVLKYKEMGNRTLHRHCAACHERTIHTWCYGCPEGSLTPLSHCQACTLTRLGLAPWHPWRWPVFISFPPMYLVAP